MHAVVYYFFAGGLADGWNITIVETTGDDIP
jgi:hypothetical protein